jgi:RNA polymerase sigma factor (sigma-70 family)
MSDFRVDIKVRNSRILSKIEEVGRKPGPALAAEIGIPYAALNEYINVSRSPFDSDLNVKETAKALCDFLKCSIWDLFSQEHIDTLEENTASIEVSADDITALLNFSNLIAESESAHMLSDPYEDKKRSEIEKLISDGIENLRPKQQAVIKRRFGLDGFQEMTRTDIAEEYGCSASFIRVIEMEALRRLRQSRHKLGNDAPIYNAAALDGYYEEVT